MAKLSAHGYEVARLTKSANTEDQEYIVTLSFRSDGHILRKLKAMNPHSTGSPHHDFGWKLYKKLANLGKRDERAPRMLKIARGWRDQSAAAGTILDYKEGVFS